MKKYLCRVLALFFLTVFSLANHAFAETAIEHEGHLSQKAILLNSATCTIYPAIEDVDVCVDKVVRKILADRDLKPDRISEIIREQASASSVKHPAKFSDIIRTQKQLHDRVLVYKLLDIIRIACDTPPAITDIDLCMDSAYHSILSARDPNSRYMNKAENTDFQRQMAGDLDGIGINVAFTRTKEIGVLHVMEGSPA